MVIFHQELQKLKNAVRDSAEYVAKEVYLIHEPMATVLVGIDVEEPMGNMIIDIGGGPETAVIALGIDVTNQFVLQETILRMILKST